MDFTDLSRFWLLLLLPVLYWLARPPRPKQRVLTAHLTQWRAAIASTRRRPVRFRRLRFLLLVIAVLALVGASTGPRFGEVVGPRRLVLVVDATASMGAGSAWSEARAEVTRLLETVPDHVDIECVRVGRTVVPMGALDRNAPLSALNAPPDTAEAGFGLAEFVSALEDEHLAVCTLTDRRGHDPVPQTGALCVVGRELSNVGIVDCRIDDHWPLPRIDLAFTLAAQGIADGEVVEVAVRRGDAEPFIVNCPVTSGSAAGTAQIDRGAGGGLVVEVVGRRDGFSADDEVAFAVPAPPAPDVVLLHDGEPDPALGAVADVIADLGGGRVVEAGVEQAGFVVADGGRLTTRPDRGILFGVALGSAASQSVRRPARVVDWARSDPMLEGIDFSGLRIRAALPGAAMPSGEPLIQGENGPLAVAVPGLDGARQLCLAFRLGDSNLGLLPAMPQLLGRCYRAAWGRGAVVASSPDNLLSPGESDLRLTAEVSNRALPAFGSPGVSLAVPLIVLALLALAARMFA